MFNLPLLCLGAWDLLVILWQATQLHKFLCLLGVESLRLILVNIASLLSWHAFGLMDSNQNQSHSNAKFGLPSGHSACSLSCDLLLVMENEKLGKPDERPY